MVNYFSLRGTPDSHNVCANQNNKIVFNRASGVRKEEGRGALGPSRLYANQSVGFLALFLPYLKKKKKKTGLKSGNATWLEIPLKITQRFLF